MILEIKVKKMVPHFSIAIAVTVRPLTEKQKFTNTLLISFPLRMILTVEFIYLGMF